MFVCLEDDHTGDKFLAVAPWIQCNNSSGYTAAVAVASICFIIYVLGIPALFTYPFYPPLLLFALCVCLSPYLLYFIFANYALRSYRRTSQAHPKMEILRKTQI